MKRKTVVYIHKRKDTGEIFYVGIGDKYRPNCKDYRNKYWWNIVNKYGYNVEIVKTGLTWDDACEEEIRLIKLYGRKDLGLGTLVNMTDGGDGAKGIKWSKKRKKDKRDFMNNFYKDEKKRELWSELTRGENNGFYGKSHTKESKKKISISKKGQSAGERNPKSKLKKNDILWIRKNGVTGRKGNLDEISKKYGVRKSTIRNIINRKSWTHI